MKLILYLIYSKNKQYKYISLYIENILIRKTYNNKKIKFKKLKSLLNFISKMDNKLIINNEAVESHDILFKEIKKMTFIKYLNLVIAISRFFLMFYIATLFGYFPISIDRSPFFIFMFIFFSILILPIFTIINLLNISTSIINRNFTIKNEISALDYFKIFCCCCCCFCSRNVTYLKYINLILGMITLIWFLYILYFFFKDGEAPNNKIFFFYNTKKVITKLILYFIDSILLICHWYCFHYYEYFLNRGKIYIEFYKRLIIKNRNKEAEIVRNELPINIDYYFANSGTELDDV